LDKYLVVLAGAGVGGLMRYVAGTWIMSKYGGRFPLGTLAINVTGAFLIGILGGYTTISSFEYEIYQAMRDGERWLGLFYMTASVLLGYLGVWLGTLLARGR
jgi:CrcB protein